KKKNMKKIALLMVMSVFSLAAVAQTSKGTLLLGGGAGFKSESEGESSSSTLELSPNLGYFFADNLAVGAQIAFTSYGGDKKGSMYSIGPAIRYYAFELGSNAKIFGEANFGFGSFDSGEEGADALSSTSWGIKAGPAFFLNESIALETTVGYGSEKVKDAEEASSSFGVKIGLQIHFAK
ncbi:MAG: outer membrane beta-barrel protein, partial [Bacteroidota bacterium]